MGCKCGVTWYNGLKKQNRVIRCSLCNNDINNHNHGERKKHDEENTAKMSKQE